MTQYFICGLFDEPSWKYEFVDDGPSWKYECVIVWKYGKMNCHQMNKYWTHWGLEWFFVITMTQWIDSLSSLLLAVTAITIILLLKKRLERNTE